MKQYRLTLFYKGKEDVHRLHNEYLQYYNPGYALIYMADGEPLSLFVRLDLEPEQATFLALAIPDAMLKPLNLRNNTLAKLSSNIDYLWDDHKWITV